MNERKNNKIVVSILILFASIISLFCCLSIANKSNFLSTDVSVWVNIAKMMDQGKMIYRDIFDNKGPILYFLYFWGYKFGGKLGIWMINYISLLIDIAIIYIFSKKFNIGKKKSIIVAGISVVFLSFIYCNESTEIPCTESLALPFILISLYEFIKFNSDIKKFGKKESLYTRNVFRSSFIVKT